jgi:hypothetical protein
MEKSRMPQASRHCSRYEKYGQYHRPIARPILFWLNGDSFMPPGGLCHPSDDFGSKF